MLVLCGYGPTSFTLHKSTQVLRVNFYGAASLIPLIDECAERGRRRLERVFVAAMQQHELPQLGKQWLTERLILGTWPQRALDVGGERDVHPQRADVAKRRQEPPPQPRVDLAAPLLRQRAALMESEHEFLRRQERRGQPAAELGRRGDLEVETCARHAEKDVRRCGGLRRGHDDVHGGLGEVDAGPGGPERLEFADELAGARDVQSELIE